MPPSPSRPQPTARHDSEFSERVLKHWREAVPNDRMAHLVKDATRGFLRSLQVRLAEHDVQLGHWTFLRILWNREGITQRELSLEAGFMESTTLVALRAMEALGYVTRERRPTNRKNVYVFLTAKGKALEEVLVPLAGEVNALATRGIATADLGAARRALLAMVENLARDPAILASVDVPASTVRSTGSTRNGTRDAPRGAPLDNAASNKAD